MTIADMREYRDLQDLVTVAELDLVRDQNVLVLAQLEGAPEKVLEAQLNCEDSMVKRNVLKQEVETFRKEHGLL